MEGFRARLFLEIDAADFQSWEEMGELEGGLYSERRNLYGQKSDGMKRGVLEGSR